MKVELEQLDQRILPSTDNWIAPVLPLCMAAVWAPGPGKVSVWEQMVGPNTAVLGNAAELNAYLKGVFTTVVVGTMEPLAKEVVPSPVGPTQLTLSALPPVALPAIVTPVAIDAVLSDSFLAAEVQIVGFLSAVK